MQPFRIGRIQKFDQPRKTPRRRFERQRAVQRLIQIGLSRARRTTAGAAVRTPLELAQPDLEKFDIGRRDRQLQRIESGGYTVLQREIFAAQRPHQNLESAILVEDHLRGSLSASMATRKPMNTVLPDPVGPQMSVWPVSLRLPPSGSWDRWHAARSNRASARW